MILLYESLQKRLERVWSDLQEHVLQEYESGISQIDCDERCIEILEDTILGLKQARKRIMSLESLNKYLTNNHLYENGCWHTRYENIPHFEILASTTNGTSGTGLWYGKKVYFSFDYERRLFRSEYTT